MDKSKVIFEELQRRSKEVNKFKLESSYNCIGFRSSLFAKKIIYNPSYNKLSDCSIRFILLHEVGHKQSKSFTLYGILIGFLGAILANLGIKNYFSDTSPFLFIVIIFLVPLAIFFMIFRMFIPLMRGEEFMADTWASKQYMNLYGEKYPSKLIAKVLTEYKEVHPQKSLIRSLLRLVYKLIKYHPTLEERIENVKKLDA